MLEAEASRDICEYDSIDFESLLHEQAKQHWFPDPLCIPDSSWLHSLQLSSLPLHSGRTWTEENGWNDGPVFVPSVALATKRSSRHSRFGTSMQTVAADGTLNAWILKNMEVRRWRSLTVHVRAQINVTCQEVSASVMQKSIIQKSSACEAQAAASEAQLPLISYGLEWLLSFFEALEKGVPQSSWHWQEAEHVPQSFLCRPCWRARNSPTLRWQHLFQLEILNMLKCWSLNKVCPGSQSAESTCVGNWRCQFFTSHFSASKIINGPTPQSFGSKCAKQDTRHSHGFCKISHKDECPMGYPWRVRKNLEARIFGWSG